MIKYMLGIGILIMNLIGFISMGWDKHCAKVHRWRVPEKTLFGICICGGTFGSWVGMYVFRHKTKHWYFVLGMPLICIVESVLFAVYVVPLMV